LRRVAFALGGAVAAVAVANAVAGCMWLCGSSSLLRAGTFTPDTSLPQYLDDYQLVVDDDFATVHESFTVDGHRWERTYRVVERTNVHN
jgi:hypothetical protein